MKNRFIQHSLILILSFAPFFSNAQKDSLRQEVEVVKAYQPSISDAFKINDLPKIQDTKRQKPNFNYQINSQPVYSTFKTEPVQAAQMVGEMQPTLEKGLLKVGAGNYLTPYAELFYNTKAGKNSDFGLHFKHLSSNGKVKLVNDDKVDAPYSNNIAELFSRHYFRSSSLITKLYFERNAHEYYGYAGEEIPNDQKANILNLWGEKQAFSKGGFHIELFSNKTSRSETNYNFNLNYQYFESKTGQTENTAKFGTKLSHEFETFNGLIDASVSYLKTDNIFNSTNNILGQKQQILLQANPRVLFEADNASLLVGFNLSLMLDDDKDARALITPNIRGEWSPIEKVISLYAGANGYLKHNHYSVIAKENAFVNPLQDIANSEYQYILFGGINGKFSPKFNYRLEAKYASIKDEYFYVTNSRISATVDDLEISSLNNTFDVLYDDINQLTLSTELYYTASDLLSFHFKGNHYSYDLKTLSTAWHKPNFDGNISMKYSPDGPLSFNADILLIGERKAPIINNSPVGTPITNITMDPAFDLNFGINYQYTPQLSFFGRANNFAFQKYESWLGYARQGFNLLIGASYSF